MKTKKDVLIENKYEILIGYCFSTPPADSEMLTFVDKEEAEAVIAKGAQTYYWSSDQEMLWDEEQAWEDFYERHCDDNDLDLSLEDFNKRMGVE